MAAGEQGGQQLALAQGEQAQHGVVHGQFALAARGHAAQQAIRLDTPQERSWREERLPEPLHKARAHPEWSSLNPGRRREQPERQEQIRALAAELG